MHIDSSRIDEKTSSQRLQHRFLATPEVEERNNRIRRRCDMGSLLFGERDSAQMLVNIDGDNPFHVHSDTAAIRHGDRDDAERA